MTRETITNSDSEQTRSLIEKLDAQIDIHQNILDSYSVCPRDFHHGAVKALQDAVKIIERYWQAYVPVQSEISVVDDKLLANLVSLRMLSNMGDYDELANQIERCIDIATKPVSGSLVSLAKCKWELSKVFVPNGIWNIDEGMKMERAAKAVLDTAGVKYVD
jgi:hypothetical protein